MNYKRSMSWQVPEAMAAASALWLVSHKKVIYVIYCDYHWESHLLCAKTDRVSLRPRKRNTQFSEEFSLKSPWVWLNNGSCLPHLAPSSLRESWPWRVLNALWYPAGTMCPVFVLSHQAFVKHTLTAAKFFGENNNSTFPFHLPADGLNLTHQTEKEKKKKQTEK